MNKSWVFIFTLVLLLVTPHTTITVRPSLCPTNKIAPHRRLEAYGRTFAAYYDLLTPSHYQAGSSQHPLQETPQPDEPDDCGDIDDYDENDLSSVTRSQRRRGRNENRFFFGGLFQRPQQLPPYKPSQTQVTTVSTPTKPLAPTYPPQRPPYWSGGYFSQNQYRPPLNQVPSDNLKPVHEASDILEAPQTYRPGLVGGPLGHVVGLSQARPTPTATSIGNTRRRIEAYNQMPTQPTLTNRRPRPRRLNDDSIIGSFVDLFFK